MAPAARRAPPAHGALVMEDLPAANEGVADERVCEWGWNIIWAPRRPTLASATGSGAGARGRDIEAAGGAARARVRASRT